MTSHERFGVSNNRYLDSLFKSLFRLRTRKPQSFPLLALCEGKPLLTGRILSRRASNAESHGDVIKWKHFPRYLPFVRGIRRSPVNSPHKGQWREALMFSLICAWVNGWVNNREAGNLRHHRAHFDVTAMIYMSWRHLIKCKTRILEIMNPTWVNDRNFPWAWMFSNKYKE